MRCTWRKVWNLPCLLYLVRRRNSSEAYTPQFKLLTCAENPLQVSLPLNVLGLGHDLMNRPTKADKQPTMTGRPCTRMPNRPLTAKCMLKPL
ncbi:hypothetical protein BJX68DRAFT_73130 [Aspergillus pseudodeflectus]|uniref:Uncharacterized protein n=1 Tax=Aspergillus pseudodeflectus TaxID=176178 RepID=A0ABR4KG84_9EURO